MAFSPNRVIPWNSAVPNGVRMFARLCRNSKGRLLSMAWAQVRHAGAASFVQLWEPFGNPRAAPHRARDAPEISQNRDRSAHNPRAGLLI